MNVAVSPSDTLSADLSRREGVEALAVLANGSGWSCRTSALASALPHGIEPLTGWDILDALAALRIPVSVTPFDTGILPPEAFPCLRIEPSGAFQIVNGHHRDLGQQHIDPLSKEENWVGEPEGAATIVRLGSAETHDLIAPPQTASATLAGLVPHLWPLFFASLLISVLGLITPIVVMVVYNTAIPSRSLDFLIALSIGLIGAFCFELIVRKIRSAAIVHVAAGLENRLGLSLLHKLVAFPVGAITRSDAFQQRARLRQFESMRDAMMGPLVQATLDIPFLILFGFALFLISPTIAWLTLGFAALNALTFFVSGSFLRRYEAAASDAQTDYQKLALEAANSRRTIHQTGAAPHWQEKLIRVAETAQDTVLNARKFNANAQTISQAITTIAGLSAGFVASSQVMRGELALGGLIGVLILVWRFLGPIQTLSLASEQAFSIRANLRMIDAVLQIPVEPYRGAAPALMAPLTGHLRLEQVSFRYPQTHLPALTGVNAEVRAGEILALTGNAMAGKTTLAELIAGLHQPLAGRITIDGQDIRQIAVDDLRAAISFCQQMPAVFYGTILQNLEIAQPLLTENAAWIALGEAGIADQVRRLKDGLNTRLSQDVFRDMPWSMQRGICLAMVFARDTPIYVFDQPTAGLDPEHAQIVRKSILARKESSSILLITHDVAELQLSDRFVVLERGRALINDKGPHGLNKTLAIVQPKEEVQNA